MPAPRGKRTVIPGGTRRFERPDQKKNRPKQTHTVDPPELMEMCLNCTRDSCDYGDCREVRTTPTSRTKLARGKGGNKSREMMDLRRKRWEEGWTDAQLAEAFGVAVKSIRNWRRGRGLPENR